MTLYEKGKLYDISIADLRPDPNQPRKSMDPQALNELTASIKTHGIIQPLLFRVAPDDIPTLIIVAGERRYKAAQEAGLPIVPGICVEGDPSEIALIENMLRQDLTPIEEAEALQALMDERDYTQEQLSNVIGKARTTLTEILSLNKLPQEVRDDCRGDHAIPRAALIAIAKKKQARSMVTAYTAYKKSQNKEKTTRTRKAPDSCAPISDLIGATTKRLSAIDPADWDVGDMEGFRSALLALKEWIDAFLAPSDIIEGEYPRTEETIREGKTENQNAPPPS